MNTPGRTLVIFSGLPGTGKSSLSEYAASKLNWQFVAIDDVASAIPQTLAAHAEPFWDTIIGILLSLAEAQLQRGFNVIVDSVFMGPDRLLARDLARRMEANFRPIHTYVSDEAVWIERLRQRRAEAPPGIFPATWRSQVSSQRRDFWPWQPGTALFVDALQPLASNQQAVLDFITSPQVALRDL